MIWELVNCPSKLDTFGVPTWGTVFYIGSKKVEKKKKKK